MSKKKVGKKTKRARIIVLIIAVFVLLCAGFVGYKLIRRIIRKHTVKQPVTVTEEIKEEEEEVQRLITIDEFEGDVTVFSPSLNEAVPLSKGLNLISEDEITVNSGKVKVLIDTDKHIEAENNVAMSIKVTGSEEKGIATIIQDNGSVLYTIDNPLNPGCAFDVKTPNAVCSVRGTTFRVTYNKEEDTTDVEVIKGKVEVTDRNDGKAYIVDEGKTLAIPYTEYGYFDDNVAPAFHVDYPQFAFYRKNDEDSSYPDKKFDPLYGITAIDEVDGDCTADIVYEISDADNGSKKCTYSVGDKAGNTDSFSIYYTEGASLDIEGDFHTTNGVEIIYTIRDSNDE